MAMFINFGKRPQPSITRTDELAIIGEHIARRGVTVIPMGITQEDDGELVRKRSIGNQKSSMGGRNASAMASRRRMAALALEETK